MRLSAEQIFAIRIAIDSVTAGVVAVRLFGSRLNDDALGGDVDLMIDVEHCIEHPAELAARLAVRISRAIGDRNVDVVLRAPNLEQSSIHKIALEEGILI